MNADRRVRLWRLVVEQAHGDRVEVRHVCATMIEVGGVDSAAVTVALNATPRETLFATDQTAARAAELALTLGEGPCVDAFGGAPVLVADLTDTDCLARWPVFAPALHEAGVGAVFALPLQAGAIVLGCVNLYRTRTGSLGDEQVADVLVLADTVCALLLDSIQDLQPTQRAWDAPSRLDGTGGPPAAVDGRHPEVHQATGMIIVQLGVSAPVAFARLRAYAYAHDRRLRDVARDVVARRLRFDDETDRGAV